MQTDSSANVLRACDAETAVKQQRHMIRGVLVKERKATGQFVELCSDWIDGFVRHRLPYGSELVEDMLLADHLQPAAQKAGITGRVGFHTLRRTLASALVANGNDPKLVQELLRHANVKTTLDVFAQAMTPAKLEAQGWVLEQLLTAEVKSTVM